MEKVSDVKVEVKRNNEIELSEFENYNKIVISPGPGLPDEAGITLDFIKHYHRHKSIFGVCLGHQALAMAFGIKLINLPKVYHGVATTITSVANDKLFEHLPSSFLGGRYHSWIVNKFDLAPEFELTAIDEEGNCMAMRHTRYDLCGVQFHPESILTEQGEIILKNWIEN